MRKGWFFWCGNPFGQSRHLPKTSPKKEGGEPIVVVLGGVLLFLLSYSGGNGGTDDERKRERETKKEEEVQDGAFRKGKKTGQGSLSALSKGDKE